MNTVTSVFSEPVFAPPTTWIYSVMFLIGLTFCVLSVFWAVRKHGFSDNKGFVLLMLHGTWWCGFSALNTVIVDPHISTTIRLITGIHEPIVALVWTYFVRDYTGYKKLLPNWFFVFMGIEATLFSIGIVTLNYHSLYAVVTPLQEPYTTFVFSEKTILYLAHRSLHYLAIGYGMLLVFYLSFRVRSVQRTQSVALLAGSFVPFFLGIGRDTGLLDVPVRLTAVGLAFFGPIAILGLYRYKFLDVAPIAREYVIDNLDDTVVITDSSNNIIRYHPGNTAVFPTAVKTQTHIEESLPSEIYENTEVLDTHELRTETTLSTEYGQKYHYDIEVEPLKINQDVVGKVVTLHDITEIVNQNQELERQVERLEQFASTLSHDLRNPLNIADMYIEMAEDTGEEDHFERVTESYERMETLIQDVLTLAREGQTIENPDETSLSDTVNASWDAVQTDANLNVTVDADRTILADRSRLKSILENLFRNAEEHGDASEVTVDVTDDGFYVADNGEGIPEEKQEDIFDHGFTTNEDGTGFGLSIVSEIAGAHGWSVHLEESESGGAKFVFTNVETPD